MQMMRNNPSVCFEVDGTNPMGGWKLSSRGVFTVADGKDREEGLKVLLERKVPAMASETFACKN